MSDPANEATKRPAKERMEGPLRLCLVTETHSPEINGVALMLERLANELCDLGVQLTTVRPRQRHESAVRGPSTGLNDLNELVVPGFPLPGYPSLRFGWPAFGRLWWHWRRSRPDIVHIVTEGPLGWAALAAARTLRIPVTSSFHTNFPEYGRHYGYGESLARGYLRAFHRRTLRTLVPTPSLARELEAQGFGRTGLLGRGVDTRRFDPRQRDRELRASWGVEAGDPVVLHVGRLAPEKNVDLLLPIAADLALVAPRARLVIVGDGPRRAYLEAALPRAIFCGQRLGEDLAAHYASADIFVFPSLTDTFGNVVLEAMASGLAVVAFDRGAAAMYLSSAPSAGFVPIGSCPSVLRRAVTRLATDPAARRSAAATALAAAQGLSWRRVAEDYLNEICEAAGCAPGSVGAELEILNRGSKIVRSDFRWPIRSNAQPPPPRRPQKTGRSG